MARELTNGFPLAAHVPERFIEHVFAKAFLRLLPRLTTVLADGRTLEMWFEIPTVRLVASANPFENLIDVELPLVARLSDRHDESRCVFKTSPNLIQVQVMHNGASLIAPMVDFRATGADSFSVEADVDAYREAVLVVLRNQLRNISPFTAAPLFPDDGRQFFLRTYTKAAGTSSENLLGIFITGEANIPPIPTSVVAQTAVTGDVAVLVPRDVIDAQLRASLVAAGLGSLPTTLPGDDLVLLSLVIDLRDGHVFMTGAVRGSFIGVPATADFKAWVQLWLTNDAVLVNVLRTAQDGDFVFDVLDLFSGGALTRLLEEAVPAAIGGVGAGAFGSVGLFASDVPLDQGFASARADGEVGVSPAGFELPVKLADNSSPVTIAPPYLRAHRHSREFHVLGCEFGDRIRFPRQFPTWQAAIAAGYNGCFTCQRNFNVVANGVMQIRLSRPLSTVHPGSLPSYKLSYVDHTKRFGVRLAPPDESSDHMRDHVEGDQVVFSDFLPPLVPGAWTLTLAWDGWSVSGPVEVRKRWLDAQGTLQGHATSVTATHGDIGITVTYNA